MPLLIFSNCIKNFDLDSMKTSSEKFEYELALNLAKYSCSQVIIYSSASDSDRQIIDNNMCLIGAKSSSSCCDTYKTLSKLIKTHKDSGDVLLFYGYDLLQIIGMIYLKIRYRISLVCFIYDTHVGAIEKLRNPKKLMASLYFTISIYLMRFLDGFILFQEAAAQELRITKPYFVTKPGIDPTKVSKHTRLQKTDTFTISYFGSLMPYNGIDSLLSAISLSDDPELRFRIFGSGDLQSKVIDYAKRDERVYYGGLIEQEQLKGEFKKADLLLNLRDPDHYVCKFAYPSKLIEYMASGIPVLSTNLGFDYGMQECVYLLDNLSPYEIQEKIEYIKRAFPVDKSRKAERAINYVIENNRWDKICQDINLLFASLL